MMQAWGCPEVSWSCAAQGSDQKRQAFSKRKRGIVLKAYQLYKLTDAKVPNHGVVLEVSARAVHVEALGWALRGQGLS